MAAHETNELAEQWQENTDSKDGKTPISTDKTIIYRHISSWIKVFSQPPCLVLEY